MSVVEIIHDLAQALMSELGIDGAPTDNIVSFAIDICAEEVDYYPKEILARLPDEPEHASLCHTTADRLFSMLGREPVEMGVAFAPAAPPSSRGIAQVARDLARDVHAAVRASQRKVYRIKFANHSFVVVVRNQKVELFQSYQWRYGVGVGMQGQLDSDLAILCLATMAWDGDAAREAQELAFGVALDPGLSREVLAYKRATLVSDDLLVSRLRERMRSGISYYKALRVRLAS
jgi:hypothetical protein